MSHTITLTLPELRRISDLILAQDAGDAPCCRYGRSAHWWAPYAAAAAYVIAYCNGSDVDTVATDTDHNSVVSLVVNDSAAPAELIYDSRHLFSRGVIGELGGLRNLRSLNY